MKRHPALREFSDDHHSGLVQALRLRGAACGDRDPVRETALAFMEIWNEDIAAHFRKEEEVLVPVFVRHGGGLSRPVIRMLIQHAQIRAMTMRLEDEIRRADLHR